MVLLKKVGTTIQTKIRP